MKSKSKSTTHSYRHCQKCLKFLVETDLNLVHIYNDIVPYIDLYLCQKCTDARIKQHLQSEGEKSIRILPNHNEIKNVIIIGVQP